MLVVRSFCLLVAVVVIAVGARAASLPQINFYAPEVGTAICNPLPCVDPNTGISNCYPQASFFQPNTNKTTYLPFPADAPRQVISAPFVYSGDETFMIRAVRISWRAQLGVTSASLVVWFYQANATNPQYPGAILPGTPALGQVVNFTKVTNQSADSNPLLDMIGFVPEINITAGLYYVAVAGYNTTKPPNSVTYNYLVTVNQLMSSNASYYSWPGYQGLWMVSTYPPFPNGVPTSTWSTVPGFQTCIWIDGATPTQVANTPPPWRIRYANDNDLSSFSGPSFVTTISGLVNATLASNASYPLTPAVFDGVTARVVIVTAARTNTTNAPTYYVDYYISGPNTVALTNLAYNLDVPTLRSNGFLSQNAVPQQVTYDHPLYSW